MEEEALEKQHQQKVVLNLTIIIQYIYMMVTKQSKMINNNLKKVNKNIKIMKLIKSFEIDL